MAKNRIRRRHRMALEKPVGTVKDAKGHVSPVYGHAGHIYAAIAQGRSAEVQEAPQVSGEAAYTIRAYYRNDLAVGLDWRITYNGRAFDISNIDNVDENNREWIFTCTEDTSARGPIGEPA